ncbi:type II toxin-antitoxin system RelB/DinJ family antitoxin [Lacicoccus qingdaonensis]|nr:type II toxin-antitoxin system RelB/DinJ family antitoxin [Salinicoccus qingdaonensis]
MGRLNLRIDDQLKEDANELFNEMGIDMSTAIKLFLTQSVREGRVPFVIGEPLESLKARHEILNEEGETYSSVKELMDNINED